MREKPDPPPAPYLGDALAPAAGASSRDVQAAGSLTGGASPSPLLVQRVVGAFDQVLETVVCAELCHPGGDGCLSAGCEVDIDEFEPVGCFSKGEFGESAEELVTPYRTIRS